MKKGFFFLRNHEISNTAIREIRDMEIRLRITRKDALHGSVDQNWADHSEQVEIVRDESDGESSAIRGNNDPHII